MFIYLFFFSFTIGQLTRSAECHRSCGKLFQIDSIPFGNDIVYKRLKSSCLRVIFFAKKGREYTL